jgi:hypothetical protein
MTTTLETIAWRKSHSPDRHLRVMAIKNDFREVSPVLGKALNMIRQDPSILEDRGRDFDEILNRLNYRLQLPEYIKEPNLYPNIALLRDIIRGTQLTDFSIGRMSDDFFNKRQPFGGSETFKNAEDTFVEVAKLISKGNWDYINNIEDPRVAVSALLIEGWGLFFEKNSGIDGIRPIFVRAFEEEMGYEYTDRNLWKDVKDWVIEEKDSFSSKFIRKISSKKTN